MALYLLLFSLLIQNLIISVVIWGYVNKMERAFCAHQFGLFHNNLFTKTKRTRSAIDFNSNLDFIYFR